MYSKELANKLVNRVKESPSWEHVSFSLKSQIQQVFDIATAAPTPLDLQPHLRQFMHNDSSGLVAGYDIEGTNQTFTEMAVKLGSPLENLVPHVRQYFHNHDADLVYAYDEPAITALYTGLETKLAEKNARDGELYRHFSAVAKELGFANLTAALVFTHQMVPPKQIPEENQDASPDAPR